MSGLTGKQTVSGTRVLPAAFVQNRDDTLTIGPETNSRLNEVSAATESRPTETPIVSRIVPAWRCHGPRRFPLP